MIGFTAVMSVLAILVAMGALWMVGEAIRKIQTSNQNFFKVHIRGLKDIVNADTKAVKTMAKRTVDIEGKVQDLVDRLDERNSRIEALERELRETREIVAMIDRNLPKRFRHHQPTNQSAQISS